ncbi:MAG: HIT domain-containing protein [Magnetospirillum sp.]|nr:HIT domain-containing protein [Magnetospirillum sp.]
MFDLHERLAADTVAVVDWPLCRVLLMNDSTYPWLILVPRRRSVTEIHELDADDRQMLIEEVAAAAHRLQSATGAVKMNVAALGNVVAQLHVHVVARFTTDSAWPRPVWGAVPATPYTDAALAERLVALRALLAEPPAGCD